MTYAEPPTPRVLNTCGLWHCRDVNTREDLITEWLNLPDAADVLGLEVSQVRRLIDEGKLIDVRRGQPPVRYIPAEMLKDGQVVKHLPGTITVLRDAGFSDEETLTWLFENDDTLPGRPIDHLRAGQRGEVRRRAQALAF